MDLQGISITSARRVRRSRFEAITAVAALTVTLAFVSGGPGLSEISETSAPRRFAESAPAGHRVALVLGGGARGAAQIGVLRVHEERNMSPDMIVANSMMPALRKLFDLSTALREVSPVQ